MSLKYLRGCLFTRTLFTEEFLYTLLHMLKCLKLYVSSLTSLICDTPDLMEISSYPCNCIYIYNKSH